MKAGDKICMRKKVSDRICTMRKIAIYMKNGCKIEWVFCKRICTTACKKTKTCRISLNFDFCREIYMKMKRRKFSFCRSSSWKNSFCLSREMKKNTMKTCRSTKTCKYKKAPSFSFLLFWNLRISSWKTKIWKSWI